MIVLGSSATGANALAGQLINGETFEPLNLLEPVRRFAGVGRVVGIRDCFVAVRTEWLLAMTAGAPKEYGQDA